MSRPSNKVQRRGRVFILGLVFLIAFASCASKDTKLEKGLVGQWHMLAPQPPLSLVAVIYHSDGTYETISKYEQVRLAGLMNVIKEGRVCGTYCVKNGHQVATVNESSMNTISKGVTTSDRIIEVTDNRLVVETQGEKAHFTLSGLALSPGPV